MGTVKADTTPPKSSRSSRARPRRRSDPSAPACCLQHPSPSVRLSLCGYRLSAGHGGTAGLSGSRDLGAQERNDSSLGRCGF